MSSPQKDKKDLKSIIDGISQQIEELGKSYNELLKKTIELAKKTSISRPTSKPVPRPKGGR